MKTVFTCNNRGKPYATFRLRAWRYDRHDAKSRTLKVNETVHTARSVNAFGALRSLRAPLPKLRGPAKSSATRFLERLSDRDRATANQRAGENGICLDM
jgi:hypothetical protein